MTKSHLNEGVDGFDKLWEKWIAVINEYVNEENDFYNLTQGITDEQLDKTQSQLDVRLPQVLLNFYKIHNVEWDAVTSAFSFSVNNWSYDLLPFEAIPREWQANNDLNCDEFLNCDMIDGFSDKVRADNYTNPRWIPFAEGRNGDFLMIDTDPSEKGTFGQIIELQNETWSRIVVADSLQELIKQQIEVINIQGDDFFEFIIEEGYDSELDD